MPEGGFFVMRKGILHFVTHFFAVSLCVRGQVSPYNARYVFFEPPSEEIRPEFLLRKGTVVFFITDAMAQTAAASDSAGGILMQILPIALICVVFWFFRIRPQQKRQKEHMKMCSELAKGDEILTLGGIAGRIADLNEQYIVIEISRVDDKPVTITMQRGAVQTVLPKGTIKSI